VTLLLVGYEYIGILLGAQPILHISRIKVNLKVVWGNGKGGTDPEQ
jgi:hypothetical protein